MTLDRALKICVWAAKCHAHREQSQMPLGRLPHTTAEVLDAIRIVEAYHTYANTNETPKNRPEPTWEGLHG